MAVEAGAAARRPRLLILTPDYPPSPGGIQVMTQRLAQGLERFERRVMTLAAPDGERSDAEEGVRVRRTGATWLPRGARNGILNVEAVRSALAFRPHVVLSMHTVTSPAAATVRRLLGARVAQYFHAEEIGVRPSLAAFAARRADVVLAVSRYTASLVRGTGVEPRDLRLIPPGVDVPDDPAPIAPKAPTILTVARLEERYKGHDTMCRALPMVLAKVPDARWTVLGEGRLRGGIEALLAAYGVAHAASLLGSVDDGERNRWLRSANLLAMPSRLPGNGFAGEGFGIAYLEAGAYGKPVVAGAVGGALDSVRHGETGLLVDPNDPLAVAAAITTLLEDRQLATRLGRGGRAHAESLSWPLIVERVQSVLLEHARTT